MKRLLFLFSLFASPLEAAPLITEFQAVNHGPEVDDSGASSDWIEISNPDAEPVPLENWSLTDEADQPRKWVFPAVVLQAGERLVVRASGRDRRVAGQPLHTNFSLEAAGEFLGLYPPAGPCISCWQRYPRQFSGISYGAGPGNVSGYFPVPTPGTTNDPDQRVDYVRDTQFSVGRGFFTDPFAVSLTCRTPGGQIRYTVNGDVPTEASLLYTGPIPITTTTTLRVRAFQEEWLPSNTDTQSYIFAATWKTQPDFPAGFSTTWGQFNTSVKYRGDYGINPSVTNSTIYGPAVIPAMTTTLPILCVTGNAGDIFGDAGIHGDLRKTDAEVPVGVEFFNPLNPADQWSARAALQAHGAAVRDFPKKAFRLDFTGALGDGELHYPLFQGSKSERFDQLVLRGGGHDSFTARVRGGPPDANDRAFHATYLRDQFLRRTEVAAGLVSPHGRYVHLCINGLYWGLYDLHERPNAEFFAAQAGGKELDWDVLHHGTQLVDGDYDAWGVLQAKAAAGVQTAQEYAALAALTGPDRLIDHLLIRMWGADHDWLGPVTMPSATTVTTGDVAYYNSKNWYAARRSRGAGPGEWQFFTWDGEISMGSHLLFSWIDGTRPQPSGMAFPRFRELRLDMTGISQPDTPAAVWDALRQWPELRLRVADRARRLFGPGGVLSPANAAARIESMRAELDLPMVAESARWGMASGFTFTGLPGGGVGVSWENTLLTRDTHWRPEVAWLRDTWCTERLPVFLDQLKARSLYPATAPVEITPPGGALGIGESFALTSPAGAMHYTLNGQDPKDGGAGVLVWPAGQGTIPGGSFTVKARVWNSGTSEWSALTEAVFSSAVPPQPGMLVISEIHYHPADPSLVEVQAGFLDDGEFEFLEIANVSGLRISLGSLRFAAGVDFDFALDSSLTELAPGAVLLIAADAAALQQRYGAGLPVAGQFVNGTRLSNSGERVKLVTAAGVVIAEVSYGEQGDWPAVADGGGKSLSLLDPASGLTGTSGDAWRPSTAVGGSPGVLSGLLTYAEWQADHFTSAEILDAAVSGPLADPDGDSLVNLIEYAVVKNPRIPSKTVVDVAPAAAGKVRFTWERRRGAVDVTAANAMLQLWSGSGMWTPAVEGPGVGVTTVNSGEGTDLQTVEIDAVSMPWRFARLRVGP